MGVYSKEIEVIDTDIKKLNKEKEEVQKELVKYPKYIHYEYATLLISLFFLRYDLIVCVLLLVFSMYGFVRRIYDNDEERMPLQQKMYDIEYEIKQLKRAKRKYIRKEEELKRADERRKIVVVDNDQHTSSYSELSEQDDEDLFFIAWDIHNRLHGKKNYYVSGRAAEAICRQSEKDD